MKLPVLILRHFANIKSNNKNIKKQFPTIKLLQFLTNKFQGICHFCSKNSAILHGGFQRKSCQLLPQGSMDVQHNNELVQIQLSGNRQ
jgi:hypothetical protein